MKRLALTLMLLGASCASITLPEPTQAAVATTKVTLNFATWTDLGVGPLQLNAGGSQAVYVMSDTAPALPVGQGFAIPTNTNQIANAIAPTHVYASAASPSAAFVWVSAVTIASGGGGGGSSGNVFQATAFNESTASSAATTQVFGLSGTTTIYLVNYAYQTDAAATGNGTFQIVTGTGPNCSTIHQTLTPVWNFVQNAGIAEGSIGVLGASSAGDAMCVVTTASQKVNWRIGVAQQ